MTALTNEEKEDLLEPENLDWTLMSAVAGDDLRHGVQMLVNRLQACKSGGNQLTVEQIIEVLTNLLAEHKEAMHSIY